MDIKVEIKEESCFLDLCSQNDRELFIKDLVKKVKCETVTSDCDVDTKTGIERKSVGSLNQTEFCSENSELGYCKSSKDCEIQTKIEINDVQCSVERASPETLCTYNDIKDAVDEDFCSTEPPNLFKEGVSSYSSDIFSNEDLRNYIHSNIRKNSPESENARKCQSQEIDVDVCSIETSACLTPDHEKIVKMSSCLHQRNANKQAINKDNCKSVLSHQFREVHKCDIYEKSFIQKLDLKRHKLTHDCKEAYACDICQKSFRYSSHLKKHRLSHEDIRVHKCDYCDKRFKYLSDLKGHKMIHEGEKPHKCNFCNKAFIRACYLKNHKLTHEGKRPHKCNSCDKAFIFLSALKAHKLTHLGKKPYRCDVCDKTFIQLQHLKIHKLIHEGKRSYKYDETFNNLSNVKSHKLIHLGKKPSKYEFSDKTFTDLSDFKRHKLIHVGKGPCACDARGKSFLSRQMQEHH